MSASPSLTPPEHEHSAAVDEAARWLASVPSLERPRPIVPYLRERFGLTVLEVVAVIKLARCA